VRTRADFITATDPYRRELLAHCYRLLGSVHDAEDLVQETYLRAWRAYDTFDERKASLRTWLYRIATNACLTALESRARRAMPSGLGGPAEDPLTAPLDRRTDVPWLQPVPDALLDPATVVSGRDSVRLAFVAALQHLPARQRAVLILREVLAWQAAEVAELLDMSTAAVNSALQRARAQLARVAPAADEVAELSEADERRFLARYVAAFERADMTALIDILHEDVVLEMPPIPSWFTGRAAVAAFLPRIIGVGPRRVVATRANHRPAFATYTHDGTAWQAHAIHVPTIASGGVREIFVFLDPALFAAFGLPVTVPEHAPV
jgi:RNA polymerase sigma-70 factor (ECF subfamily)